MNIIHQQQPSKDTCLSACIAMAIGVPVDKVVDEFHEDLMNFRTTVPEYIHNNYPEFKCDPLLSTHNEYHSDRIYFLLVPALVNKGLLHCVMFYSNGESMCVADPNKGRGGQYYTYDHSVDPDAFQMKWFAPYFEISVR